MSEAIKRPGLPVSVADRGREAVIRSGVRYRIHFSLPFKARPTGKRDRVNVIFRRA